MEPGQLLFSLLSQAPAVTALVGTRIYPVRIPAGKPRPAIAYQLVGDATASLADCPDNERPRVQVSLFADSYETLSALARAVKTTLHGHRTGQLTIDYENGIDQVDDAAACLLRVQDYTFDFPAA